MYKLPRKGEMIKIVHAVTATTFFPKEGEKYIGSNRELLSEWLGGRVGFGYAQLPQQWANSNSIYEVLLTPDLPIVLSLNGETIPRRDYDNISFLDCLAGESFGKYFCGLASEIHQFLDLTSLGELAFLADHRAKFGQKVKQK